MKLVFFISLGNVSFSQVKHWSDLYPVFDFYSSSDTLYIGHYDNIGSTVYVSAVNIRKNKSFLGGSINSGSVAGTSPALFARYPLLLVGKSKTNHNFNTPVSVYNGSLSGTISNYYKLDSLIIAAAFGLHYSDGISNWAALLQPDKSGTVYKLYTTKNKTLIVHSLLGVFKSTDNGISWTCVYRKDYLRDVCIAGEKLFIAHPDSGLLYSTNMGQNWLSVNTPNSAINSIRSIAGTDSLIFYADQNNVYITKVLENSWRKIDLKGSFTFDVSDYRGDLYVHEDLLLIPAREPSNVRLLVYPFNFSPPNNLQVNSITSSIHLQWKKGEGIVDSKKYFIYRGLDSTNQSIIDSATSINYYDATAIQGVKNYYRISAVDSTGFESAKSYAVSATALFPPSITSFAPTSGPISTVVTINGTNFNTTASNNIVYFGAVKAQVNSATSTKLNVTVPIGATYAPITITDTTTGLTAYSSKLFLATYSGTGVIDSSSFAVKFDIATGTQPLGVRYGDLDGDGKAELVITNAQDNTVSIYRNTATSGTIINQSFAAKIDYNTGAAPHAVILGDIDGDGRLDIAVTNYTGGGISILRNQSTIGTISFLPKVDFATGSAPRSISITDIDGDGKSDIIVGNWGGSSISVFRNTSSIGVINSSSFEPKVDFTSNSPYAITVGDIDGDGKVDLVAGNSNSNTLSVFRNTSTTGNISTSSFAAKVDFTTNTGVWTVALGDLDGDNKLDIATANVDNNTISVFRNISSSGDITINSFSPKVDFATATLPSSISLADLDGNQKLDIAVSCAGSNVVSIFRNTSSVGQITNSSFAQQVTYSTGTYPNSISVGDIDGDGKPDLLLTNQNSNTVSILRNIVATQTPQNLTATAGSGQVTLKWNKILENRFLRYRIYMGSDSTTMSLKDSSTTSISDTTKTITGLTNGTKYYFRVSAIDSSRLESEKSFAVSATPFDLVVWYPFNGNANDSSGNGNHGTNNGATLTVDRFGQPGKAFHFNGTNAKITVPYIPYFNTLPLSISVWFKSGINDTKQAGIVNRYTGSSSNGYQLVYFQGRAQGWYFRDGSNYVYDGGDGLRADSLSDNYWHQAVMVIDSVQGKLLIDGILRDTLYWRGLPGVPTTTNDLLIGYYPVGDFFQGEIDDIRIYNRSLSYFEIDSLYHEGGWTSNIAPTIPKNLTALAGNGQITLRWSKNTESDFLKYRIYIGADSTTMSLKDSSTASISDTTKTITGLTNGTKYHFRVSALDSARVESGKSFAVGATPVAPPIIISFTPTSGPIGTTVTISGSNFNSTASNNIVYFGTVKATITTATSTQLTAIVPKGSNLAPINVVTNGLVSYSNNPFIVTFPSGGLIDTTSFTPRIDLATDGPYDVSIGDLDLDGLPDLIIANFDTHTISVFRNTSITNQISFAPKIDFVVGRYPVAVALGDLDGDGKLDILVTNRDTITVSVLRNTSSVGTINQSSFAQKVDFRARTGGEGYSGKIGDIDGDGRADIVVANGGAQTVSILRNIGSVGNITTESFSQPISFNIGSDHRNLALGDLDGDGKTDIALSSTINVISILRNTSTQGIISFTSSITFAASSNPYGIAILDVDGDTKQDIILANIGSSKASVFYNQAIAGSITSESFGSRMDFVTATSPYGVAFGDFNGDGKPDLAISTASNKVSVLRNTSTLGSITSTSFAANVNFNIGSGAFALSAGDLDGDSKPDIVVANYSSKFISILRNTVKPQTPQPIYAVAGNGSVNLNWDKISEYRFLRYFIYMGADSTTLSLKDSSTASISDTTKTITGLTNGTKYYFRVSALDSARLESGKSFAVSATPLVIVTEKMVQIKGGTFTMGSENILDVQASPSHSVTLSSYYISNTETRWGMWDSVYLWAKNNGYTDLPVGRKGFNGDETHPVTEVKWYDILKWCNARSQREGLTPVYYTDTTFIAANIYKTGETDLKNTMVDWSASGYRLPTEAEWEYSARGGTLWVDNFIYSGNNTIDSVAWYISNSGNNTHPVGTKKPNKLGIFDMSGNVYEWCWDWSGNYSSSAQINPYGPATGPGRTFRSGSYSSVDQASRVAFRNGGYSPISSSRTLGFRCARTYVDIIPPIMPQNLSVIPGNTEVTLKWSKNSESDFLKYLIYIGTDSVTMSLKDSTTAFISDTTKIISGLTNGIKYYFRISALDSARLESGKSLAASATPQILIPTIVDFNPKSGPVGTAVTITGVNFNTAASSNIVYFGAVRAVVSSATSIMLTVTVPTGSTYEPISVTDTTAGLSTYSTKPFIVTFPSARIIDSTSYATKVDFTTGTNAYSIAIGDLDGDGKTDLVVPNNNNSTISVFRNTSTPGSITPGSFASKVDFTTVPGPWSVAIRDVDGDGKPDIVVIGDGVSILRNTIASDSITESSFAPKVDFTTGPTPWSVVIDDMDRDGKPELVVANKGSASVSVFRNTSTPGSITPGSFASKVDFSAGSEPSSVATGDVDGDGKPDIVVVSGNGSIISVYRNISTIGYIFAGSFEAKVDFTTGSSPRCVAFGDVDGDGNPDLVVTNLASNSISVFRNTSTPGSITPGSFASKVDFTTVPGPWRITFGDVNGDGKPDLAVANSGSNSVSIFRNTSAPGSVTASSFATRVDFPTGTAPYGAPIGDIDGDGKPDLVVVNLVSSNISVLRNTIGLGIITPEIPKNLIATAGNSQVTLKWFKNTDPDFLKYRIYIGADSTTMTLKDSTSASISDTSKTITGLTNGTKYYFRVSALDSARLESIKSIAVSATPAAPIVLNSGEYLTDTNTVLLLHMNESSGSTVNDASGQNNNGTATGTTVGVGRFGKARSFNHQNNEWLKIPSNAGLRPTGEFTLEFWIKPAYNSYGNVGGQAPVLLSNQGPTSLGGYTLIILNPGAPSPKNDLNFAIHISDQSGKVTNSKTLIDSTRWMHVAGIYKSSGSSSWIQVLINGVKEDSIFISNSSITYQNASSFLYIGNSEDRLDGYRQYWGLIDEVRISNIARLPQQFNLQLPPKNISAIASGTTINISWQNGGGAVPLMRNKIYRGADSTTMNLIDSTVNNFYPNTGLSASTKYYYRTTAVDSTGFEGAKSFAVSAITGIPGTTPTVTSINPTSGLVGTDITIAGTNFGATQGTNKVEFAKVSASIKSWSDTQIIATVPTGISGIVKVEVKINGISYESPTQFTITVPAGPAIVLSTTTMSFGSITPGLSLPKTLTITNTGNAVLTGTISVTSNAGFTISKASINISAGASDSIIVTFSPNAAQNYNATLTINHNATGSPSTVSLLGTGQAVSGTASITLSQNSILVVKNGTIGTLEIPTITVVNNGTLSLTGTVSFTGISFLTMSSSAFLNVSPDGGTSNIIIILNGTPTIGTFTGTISITHNAAGGTSTIPVTVRIVDIPTTIDITKSITFSDPKNPASYKLIGIPGIATRSPASVLAGEYNKDWRMYRDNGAATNYLEEYDNSTKFDFGAGKGFWVLTSKGISLSGPAANATPANGAFGVSLQNGWNIISNPFDRSIIWNDVKNFNNLPVNSVLWEWDNGLWSATISLIPFSAYYFNNISNNPVLSLPYDPAGTLGKISTSVDNIPISEKHLKFVLQIGTETKSKVFIGFDSTASDDYDIKDYPAPPGSFASANIMVENNSISIPNKQLYVEHRKEIGEGQKIELVVQNSTNKVAALLFDGIQNFTSDEVYIVDENSSVAYNLKQIKQIAVSPSTEIKRFTVFMGNSTFVAPAKAKVQPNEFTLYQNFPNPFNPVTMISYYLPKQSHVTLKIFDILGRTVKEVVNSDQSPGYYLTSIDGSSLSSGTYIYRLQANDFVQVKKMMLLK